MHQAVSNFVLLLDRIAQMRLSYCVRTPLFPNIMQGDCFQWLFILPLSLLRSCPQMSCSFACPTLPTSLECCPQHSYLDSYVRGITLCLNSLYFLTLCEETAFNGYLYFSVTDLSFPPAQSIYGISAGKHVLL